MRDMEELARMIDYYVTGNPKHYDEQLQEQFQDDEECDFSIPEYKGEPCEIKQEKK